jgi:type IV pilus assembly protein PilE
VAIIGILSTIALPAYSAYVLRSKIPVGLENLASYQARMEQAYQDTGSYGSAACSAAIPAIANFTLSCTLTAAGQGFTAQVDGNGPLAGISYSADQNGKHLTLAHPNGVPTQSCWTIRGGTCDS